MTNAVELKGVSFSHGETRLFSGLDLNFAPGKLHAVIGPNGSGKSTLLDLLSGYRTPDAGLVRLMGMSLADYPSRELARTISLVPQEFQLAFSFSVHEAVLMGRNPHIPRFSRAADSDNAAVQSALKAMDLTALANRSVTRLSGGERQRTVMARALAQDTPIMLLDEPTASMDIRHGLNALRKLRELAEQGRTIITVLHDLNLAASFAHDLLVLKEGAVCAQGSVENVLNPELIQEVFEVEASVMTTENGSNICFSTEGAK